MQSVEESVTGLEEQEQHAPATEHAWSQPRRRLPRIRLADRWSTFG